MWCQWYYHLTLLFARGKRVVSRCVPKSTLTVHVSNYNCFSQCTTTFYSIVSKQLFLTMICFFIKQQFYLLHRSLHIIYPHPLTLKLKTLVYTWTPNLWDAVVLHCISMYIHISSNQKNNTQDTNVLSHRSTTWSQQCWTYLIRQGAVLSLWYGRSCQYSKFWDIYYSSWYIRMTFSFCWRLHYLYVVAVILSLHPYLCYR